MTDNDKMCEEFEKWAYAEYFDLTSVDGFYSDKETDNAWGAWLAAKSVQMVGEHVVLGWYTLSEPDDCERISRMIVLGEPKPDTFKRATEMGVEVRVVYEANPPSITATELERLLKCELLLREARDDVADQLNYMLGALAGYPTNDNRIQKQREFLAAIDAAIAGEKK